MWDTISADKPFPTIPAGTIQLVASRAQRHNARHNTPGRHSAEKSQMLLTLYEMENTTREHGTPAEINRLDRHGLHVLQKKLLDASPQTISRTKRRLEQDGLIVTLGRSAIKLTEPGRAEAQRLIRADGRSRTEDARVTVIHMAGRPLELRPGLMPDDRYRRLAARSLKQDIQRLEVQLSTWRDDVHGEMQAGLALEENGVLSSHPAQGDVDRVISVNIAALEERLKAARSELKALQADPERYLAGVTNGNARRLWNLIRYTAVGRHKEELLSQLPEPLRAELVAMLQADDSQSQQVHPTS